MPSLIRRAVLGLVLLGPGALAAQTISSPRADDLPRAFSAVSSPDNASSLQTAAERLGRAVQADFQVPQATDATAERPDGLRMSLETKAAAQEPSPPPLPLPRAGKNTPLKLSPPGQATSGAPSRTTGGAGTLMTMGSSLAIVIGLFLLFAWMVRRTAPGATAALPKEVVEVLGRSVVAQRQQLHLLRLGRKLVLISVTPAGVETLTEVTDPDEVTRLVGLCQQAQSGSTTAAFRQVFQQLAGEHAREI